MNENWDMIGHEWAVKLLQRHIAQDTLRHAYLISGAPGLGRRTLALRLAQAVACPQPAAPGLPCGTCQTCRRIAAMQHPDLQIIQAEKKGGVLKVDAIRGIQRWLHLKPYQAPYRVALFLRFEEANPSAANALLKTLEEAPPHALLLLTASAPEDLLPTIVSRCEILRLHPVGSEKIAAALQARHAAAETVTLLSRLAEGRPGYAFHLLNDDAARQFRQEALDDVENLLAASRVERFARAAALAKDKILLRNSLQIWLSFWRDLMLTSGDIPLVNIDREDFIRALAQNITYEQAARQVQALEEAIRLLDGNINAQLLAENLLLDWPHIAPML